MASGLGVKGTVGRCYGFYADLMQCQQESRSKQRELFEAGDPDALKKGKKCSAPREDYFECLHQTKTRARMMTVLDEEEKQKKGGSSSGHHGGH